MTIQSLGANICSWLRFKFEMYQSYTKDKTELGIIGDTVVRLCSDIKGQTHKLLLCCRTNRIGEEVHPGPY